MKLFEDKIIEEYDMWKKANPNNFTWWNYINMKADIKMALAFSRFFYAELIEVEGCIFLKDYFSSERYSQWKSVCKNDKVSIEKAMNTYAIEDFFHINTDYDDKNITEQINELAKILKFFWELSIKQQLPDRRIITKVYNEEEILYITVFEDI